MGKPPALLSSVGVLVEFDICGSGHLSGNGFLLPLREKVRMRGDLFCTLTSFLSHRGRGSKRRILDLAASASWPVSLRLIANQASGSAGGT